MAIDLKTRYGARAVTGDAAYPGGSFKDMSAPGSDDGTPFQNAWCNDVYGLLECIKSDAGIDANGTADSVTNPQYMNGMKRIFSRSTKAPQSTIDDLCAGGVDSQWYDPGSPPNVLISGGQTLDSAMGHDLATGEPLIWVLFTTGAVHKVSGLLDFSSTPSISTAVTLAYPSTPDEVHAICADSTSVYVAWGTTGANISVSRFNSTTGAAVWTIDTGYAQSLAVASETIRIIKATAGTLAILLPGNIFGESARAIGIIAVSNGAATYGTGSYATGYGDSFLTQNSKLVSNGNHVFWIQYQDNTTYDFYLMSASIADPTTSDYASVEIVTGLASWYDYPTGILRVGDNIVVANASGVFNLIHPVASPGTSIVMDIFTLANYTRYNPIGTDPWDVIIGSDQMNMWAKLIRLDTVSAAAAQDTIFVKIPLASIGTRGGYSSAPAIDFPTIRMAANTAVADNAGGKLLFDGSSMILASRTGVIYRIANAGIR